MSNHLSHRMTVDEGNARGRLLQSRSDQLHHLTSEVEPALGRTIWEGPNAGTFMQQRWSDHCGRLQAVAEPAPGGSYNGLSTEGATWTKSWVRQGNGFDQWKFGYGGDGEGSFGNAGEWYANAGEQFRSTEPQAGSVLVWEVDDGMGSYDDVAMARKVKLDGSIVIEQSAYDSCTYKQVTLSPGSYPNKFLNFLP